jgi:hypothetical protein
MNILKLVCKALTAGALSVCAMANATVLSLPGSNAMSTGQYNSFTVYSLDLLEKCAAALDPRCLPSTGLPVQSAPGQINDQAVVLQTADGQSNFPSPFAPGASADDRFLTPTGNQSTTYKMGSFGAEPGGKFTGDQTNRWDISLSLLQTYLDGHDLVFLFDNNQKGKAPASFIFLWGQARIVDAAGATINNLCFELSANSSGCTDTGSNPNPTAAEYLPAISDFCVDKVTGISYNIGLAGNANDCPIAPGHPAGGYQVDNNTSTANAEFAAFNKALHDAATDANNGQYFLQLNIQYISNNAGAEQLWICSDCSIDKTRQVPEPASLPLILLGLVIAGITLVRTRRQ